MTAWSAAKISTAVNLNGRTVSATAAANFTKIKVISLGRKKSVNVATLFPQPDGDTCAVCKEEITDPRKQRYCHEHCRKVAYATQKFYIWKSVRKQILETDDWTCQRCGTSREQLQEEWREKKPDDLIKSHGVPGFESRFHVDHIKPVSKGGAVFAPENLQVLCKDCNLSKSDKYHGKKSIGDFYDMAEGDLESK